MLAPALGAWAAAAAVLLQPDRRWLLVVGLVGGGVGALAWSTRRSSRRAAVCAVVAVASAAGAGAAVVAAMQITAVRSGPLVAAAAGHQLVVLDAVVTDDPRPARTSGASGAVRTFVVVRMSARSLSLAGRRWAIRQPVLVIAPADVAWLHLLPTQHARISGVAAPPRGRDLLAAVVTVRGPPSLIGRPTRVERMAGAIRAGLQHATKGVRQPVAGLLPGLVDGDTSRLDPSLADDFQVAGMTHLIAVSGANIAIVVAAALGLARRISGSRRVAASVAVASLAAFVVVARPSPSVVRAGAMSAVVLLGLVTGRRAAALPALLGGVLLLVLASPTLALQAGFTLSVAATLGLLLLAPPMRRWLGSVAPEWVPRWVADLAAVAAAAQLACLPVLVALWGQLAIVAIPANMLAEPLVPLVTVLGVVAALVSPVCLPLARILVDVAAVPTRWLVVVATRAADAPGASTGVRPGLASALVVTAAVVATGVGLRHRRTRAALLAALVGGTTALVGWHVALPRWPPAGWVLVACDVGQGDGLVLRAGDRAGVVVDTGPEPEPMSRCLRRLALRAVPAVVLSHFHADHVEGVPAVLSRYRVGAVLVGSLREPATEAGRVAAWATAAHVPVRALVAGQRITIGTATLDVIAPVVLEHGTDSDPNNDSLVLRAVDDGITLLLTGDVEREAQSAILASGVPLRADVLKVPHHGSANQDPQFLAAVHARLGVVSVGADNTYGQPSPVTLSSLARDGVPTYRTDLAGDIAVVARNGRLSVVTDRSSAGRSTLVSPTRPPERGSAGRDSSAAVRRQLTAADPAVPRTNVDRSPRPIRLIAVRTARSLVAPAPSTAARGPPRPTGRRGGRQSPRLDADRAGDDVFRGHARGVSTVRRASVARISRRQAFHSLSMAARRRSAAMASLASWLTTCSHR